MLRNLIVFLPSLSYCRIFWSIRVSGVPPASRGLPFTTTAGCRIFGAVSSRLRWAIALRAIRFPNDAAQIRGPSPTRKGTLHQSAAHPTSKGMLKPTHQSVLYPDPEGPGFSRAVRRPSRKRSPSALSSVEGPERSPKDEATKHCCCSSPGTPAYSASYQQQPQKTSANSHVKSQTRQNSSRKTRNQRKINHLQTQK